MRNFLFAILCVLFTGSVFSQVVDKTNTLSGEELSRLTTQLDSIKPKTGGSVLIYLVDNQSQFEERKGVGERDIEIWLGKTDFKTYGKVGKTLTENWEVKNPKSLFGFAYSDLKIKNAFKAISYCLEYINESTDEYSEELNAPKKKGSSQIIGVLIPILFIGIIILIVKLLRIWSIGRVYLVVSGILAVLAVIGSLINTGSIIWAAVGLPVMIMWLPILIIAAIMGHPGLGSSSGSDDDYGSYGSGSDSGGGFSGGGGSFGGGGASGGW